MEQYWPSLTQEWVVSVQKGGRKTYNNSNQMN